MATSDSIRGEDGENRLRELGYEQQLQRNISFFGILGLGLGLVCLPFTVYAITTIGLTEGGPVSVLWGWVTWGTISLLIAASLGEICSVFPVAAGSYYWAYVLASHRSRKIASYVNGLFLCLGLILGTLASTFPLGQLLATSIVLFHPDYIIPAGVAYAVFLGVLVCTTILCCFGSTFLNKFGQVSAIYVTLASIVLVVVPLALCKNRHNAMWVFTHFDAEYSNWGTFSWFLNWIGPAGVMIGFGFLTSLSKEVVNPETVVPNAMFFSQLAGVVAGAIFNVATLFVMPDTLDVVSAQLGSAAHVILLSAAGTPGGGEALLIVSAVAGLSVCVGCLASAARFVFAFARDGGLPFSNWLSQVNPKLGVPVNATVFVSVICALLGLVSLGSTAAYGAFLSACTVIVLMAYVQPIMYSVLNGRREVQNAPWGLGRFGYAINYAAIAFSLFGIVLYCFPLTRPVTLIGMNWAVVVLAGFLLIGMACYVCVGHKRFRSVAEQGNDIEGGETSDVEKDKSGSGRVVAV